MAAHPKQPPTRDGGQPKAIVISASIMCADSLHLADQVRELEEAGVDWIHVDIMDAHFVPNMPLGLKMLTDLRSFTVLPLDVHLGGSSSVFRSAYPIAENVARFREVAATGWQMRKAHRRGLTWGS